MGELEGVLRSAAARGRLAVGTRAVAARRDASSPRWGLVLVLAAVLVAFAVALAVPGARSAILRALHLEGVSIERVRVLPPAQERPLAAGLGALVERGAGPPGRRRRRPPCPRCARSRSFFSTTARSRRSSTSAGRCSFRRRGSASAARSSSRRLSALRRGSRASVSATHPESGSRARSTSTFLRARRRNWLDMSSSGSVTGSSIASRVPRSPRSRRCTSPASSWNPSSAAGV